jgi:hypothetical protein
MSRHREIRSRPTPVPARDVAVGLVVLGARATVVGGRLMILPARLAARAVLMPRAARRLAAEGRDSRLRVRSRLESTGGELLAAPYVDALARSLAEHRVLERVARPVLATPDVEAALAEALEQERTRRIVEQALDSRLASQVADHLLQSPELDRVVEQIASSPAVRAALTQQTTSLVSEVAAGLRRRAERLDDSTERTARRWLRRPLRSDPA